MAGLSLRDLIYGQQSQENESETESVISESEETSEIFYHPLGQITNNNPKKRSGMLSLYSTYPEVRVERERERKRERERDLASF